MPLPRGPRLHGDLAALAGAEAVLLAVPAQATEGFLAAHAAALPRAPLVLCAKGIGARGLRLQTEIAAAAAPRHALAALTGPGFAGEIARGLPTALTPRLRGPRVGRRCRQGLSTRRLRLYLTDDVTGAELGGALKNVVAIACGMVEGAGLGASARAALMTRGFAEMTRLAVAMGARPETLSGLSGLGDLSLTCNSGQSRNFALGRALGAGAARPGGTVEGVATARAACQLGARAGRRAADRRRGRRRAGRRDHARRRHGGAARPAAARGVRGKASMNRWLFKSEAETWSWDDQVARGAAGQEWDGVRNFQARNNMKAMKRGDPGFFYHSGDVKAVVGVVEVIAEAHRDSTSDEPRWECVDIKAVAPFPQPVSSRRSRPTRG